VKLLFDENLSPRLVRRLAPLFPGSQHVDLVGLQGRDDQVIWDYAELHRFTIVSKDNDFRQISFLKGPPPKVVWLSVGNANTHTIGELVQRNHSRIVSFLENPEEALLVLDLNLKGLR
jgi:predicted nuclease of predicted toxin-antitoxin system